MMLKVKYTIVLMISRLITMYAATLQLQSIQPFLQQQQQQSPLQQLLALQQLLLIQKLNAFQTPKLTRPRPLLILLPKTHTSNHQENLFKNLENNKEGLLKTSTLDDGDEDSIVIDAEKEENGQKAILLIPNDARFSIGDFISSIPFLPIEINVPDSISWIYNGISGIISGLGQRFRPQNTDGMENMEEVQNLRFSLPNSKKVMPFLLMPMGQNAIPLQF